jgi:hypothetical protein
MKNLKQNQSDSKRTRDYVQLLNLRPEKAKEELPPEVDIEEEEGKGAYHPPRIHIWHLWIRFD